MTEEKRMKMLTTKIPQKTVDDLDLLVELKIYPNRSEAVRCLLKFGIMQEFLLKDDTRRRSEQYEFLKRFLQKHNKFKLRHITAEYITEVLKLQQNGRKFPDITNKFGKMIFPLVKSGFIRDLTPGSTRNHLYEVISLEFLDKRNRL